MAVLSLGSRGEGFGSAEERCVAGAAGGKQAIDHPGGRQGPNSHIKRMSSLDGLVLQENKLEP